MTRDDDKDSLAVHSHSNRKVCRHSCRSSMALI